VACSLMQDVLEPVNEKPSQAECKTWTCIVHRALRQLSLRLDLRADYEACLHLAVPKSYRLSAMQSYVAIAAAGVEPPNTICSHVVLLLVFKTDVHGGMEEGCSQTRGYVSEIAGS
jgi:hypothetical protein